MQGFDVAIASIVVACASIVIAAIVAVLQIRQQNQTRQAELFMELYDEYYNPKFHRRWMELVYIHDVSKLGVDSEGVPYIVKGEVDIDTVSEFHALGCFFEGIGLLVHKRLIDVQLVAELMSSGIIWVWEKVEKHVLENREILDRPQIYEWFEYLYKEIQKIPSRRGG
jgi:hypothetical protein